MTQGLTQGREWYERIKAVAGPKLVVAMGRSAVASLGAEVHVVRHPAYGGAEMFREQLRQIARDHGLIRDATL
jgi:hypothetical protein